MIQGKIIASLAFINAPITAETIPDIISWQRLKAACLSCEEYTLLHQLIEQGVPEEKNSLDSTSKICLSMCLSGIRAPVIYSIFYPCMEAQNCLSVCCYDIDLGAIIVHTGCLKKTVT